MDKQAKPFGRWQKKWVTNEKILKPCIYIMYMAFVAWSTDQRTN